MVVTELANILAKTYFDACSIYRMEDVKVGSITHQQRVKKYDNIKCSLSQGTAKTRGDNVGITMAKHKLFASYDVDIQKGDEVYIVQKGSNKAIVYMADEPFCYHGSHLEVDLKRADYE